MESQNLSQGGSIGGFNITGITPVQEIDSEVAEFYHKKSGARVLHIYNSDRNNLFNAAFRTPVYNNTGVPHILEHSVLAGSAKYPLKDPFKEMLNRSLQTFLNAVTYPDKTMYPVSSEVEEDFFNLMDIYCDAVFNPLLTQTTFMQEGWHFDLPEKGSEVSIKGIVYNEMKGVFSDFKSHVSRKTINNLFPDTTYRFESGGDPIEIPKLTYSDFKAYHSRLYHPSNSYIILYGNIPSEKTLSFLETHYLNSFDRIDPDTRISPQKPWTEPRTLNQEAPGQEEDNGKATVTACWNTGESKDAYEALVMSVLSYYLLGTESSPLKRALLDSGLGEDLCGLSGFDNDLANSFFCAGLRKVLPENAEQIKSIVFETLKQEVSEGMDTELIEGSIRHLEFSTREIRNGHFPYNLMIAERVMISWLYEGDPCAYLRTEPLFRELRKNLESNPEYFEDMIREKFINNTHFLLSCITASSEKGRKLGELTKQEAARLSKDFTQEDIDKHHETTKEIIDQQKKENTDEELACLPELDTASLPRKAKTYPFQKENRSGIEYNIHEVFTAGIHYLDLCFDISSVSDEYLYLLPLYEEVMVRCGAGGRSRKETAVKTSLYTGGINLSDVVALNPETTENPIMKLLFHSKSLFKYTDEMTAHVAEILTSPDLSDKDLIKEALTELRNDMYASVISSGHRYASDIASSKLSRTGEIEEKLNGLSQLRFLYRLSDEADYESIADNLKTLHKEIVSQNNLLVSLTSERPDQAAESFLKRLSCFPKGENKGPAQRGSFNKGDLDTITGVRIGSSVNYSARVWNLGPVSPEEAGNLMILSKNLSTGYLWDKIRVEGGAYGGGALLSLDSADFICRSYRDPNLTYTFEHFEKGLKKALDPSNFSRLKQNITGTIGGLDKPKTPHAQGFSETLNSIKGREPGFRQRIREAILTAEPGDLKSTAERILDNKDNACAVVGNTESFDKAEKQGFSIGVEEILKEDGNG
ncbi:MAG: insulinase family protein [Chitinivibrionales bacterium]